MNDDEIKELQKKLHISAFLIMDGADELLEKINALCDGKSYATVLTVLLVQIASGLSLIENKELRRESVENIPDLLKSYLKAQIKHLDENGL